MRRLLVRHAAVSHTPLARRRVSHAAARSARRVALMGLGFTGIFTSWFGTQSFAVKLLGPLGSWLIGIVYITYIVSNQIAASVVGKLGAKWTLVLGSVGYFLVVGGVATENDTLTLLGAACVGLGAGLLWSGQGRMITDLSNDDNRGLNSGLFYALMMGGSAIVGNTVTLNFAPPPQSGSASGGGDDSQAAAVHKYFLVLCVPVLVGIGCLSLLPDLPKPSEQLSVPERVGRTLSVMGSKNMVKW